MWGEPGSGASGEAGNQEVKEAVKEIEQMMRS